VKRIVTDDSAFYLSLPDELAARQADLPQVIEGGLDRVETGAVARDASTLCAPRVRGRSGTTPFHRVLWTDHYSNVFELIR
jgi:hypothetical protein